MTKRNGRWQTPADLAGDGGFFAKLGLAAFGAALALLAQVIARRAAQRSDAFRDRLDELCDGIHEFAEVAGEYWALSADAKDLNKLEAKAFGLNHRVATLASVLGEENEDFLIRTQDLVVTLSIAATGGNFQVAGRSAEPKRYMRIEQGAATLVGVIRRFQRRLLRGWLW